MLGWGSNNKKHKDMCYKNVDIMFANITKYSTLDNEHKWEIYVSS